MFKRLWIPSALSPAPCFPLLFLPALPSFCGSPLLFRFPPDPTQNAQPAKDRAPKKDLHSKDFFGKRWSGTILFNSPAGCELCRDSQAVARRVRRTLPPHKCVKSKEAALLDSFLQNAPCGDVAGETRLYPTKRHFRLFRLRVIFFSFSPRFRLFAGALFSFDSRLTLRKTPNLILQVGRFGRGDATRTRNRRFWRPLLYH